MDFGIRAHDLGQFTFKELAEHVKKHKLISVQLALAKAIKWETSEVLLNEDSANKIKSCFNDNGLKVAVLSCYINPSIPDDVVRKDEIKKFKAYLKFAKSANLNLVGTETGSLHADCSYDIWNESEQAYQICLDTMKQLVKEAEKQGVSIGIEPVVRHVLNSPQRLKRLFDDIQSDYLKVIFDPVNLLEAQTEKEQVRIFDKMFEYFGEKIVVVHLKDYRVVENELVAVPFGTGNFNASYVIEHTHADYILDEVELNQLESIIERGQQYVK